MRLEHTILTLVALVIPAPIAWSETIGASAGNNGVNNPDDVLIVQILLNQIPTEKGGPQTMLVPDGLSGPKTVAAIERFQKHQFGADSTDGRVDPGQQTIERLNSVADDQPLNDRVVRVAEGERLFWQDGQRTELQNVVSTRLQKYWKAVNLNYTLDQLRDADFQSDHPWSAAFVSWVMKKAGAGDDFRYAAAHWRYVAAAKENRNTANDNPFKAYRSDERGVEPADIVIKRRGTSTATYENIENGHMTHGDIVVSVANGEAKTIGGNVSNSVRTTTVDLDDNLEVEEDDYFAIVKVD